MSELKKEFKSYLNDLEENIKNKEDLEYIRERTAEFLNVIVDQMENVLNYKEDKISRIEKIQKGLAQKIITMQQEISEIEQELYIEDDAEGEFLQDENLVEENYDLEIVCPYCSLIFCSGESSLCDSCMGAKIAKNAFCRVKLQIFWHIYRYFQ